jgi:hypothetical protein
MPLPAANLYIHTQDRDAPIHLTNATWMKGKWRAPRGTYRDGENIPMGKARITGSSASVGEATDLPIIGVADIPATFVNAANALQPFVSDEARNIPHRQIWEIIAGYIVAIEGAQLPSLPELPRKERYYGRTIPTGPVATTINVTNEQLVFGSDHPFVNGDKVRLIWSTLPGGVPALVAGVFYRVLKVDSLNINLVDWTTGVFQTFSSQGTSVQVIMDTPARRVLPNVVSVTANHTAEEFTISGSTDFFIAGDIIALKGTTLPAGGIVAFNTPYRVRHAGGLVFQLEDMTSGALITFTGNGAGLIATLITPAQVQEEYDVFNIDGIPGLLTFPETVSISNVE